MLHDGHSGLHALTVRAANTQIALVFLLRPDLADADAALCPETMSALNGALHLNFQKRSQLREENAGEFAKDART